MARDKKNLEDAPENIRTIETRLDHPNDYAVIEDMLFENARLKHYLWNDMFEKNRASDELKREYTRKYNIMARHFNSLETEVKAQHLAIKELHKDHIDGTNTKIKMAEKFLKLKNKKIKKLEKDMAAIIKYRAKLADWRDKEWKKKGKKSKKEAKKPVLAKPLIGVKIEDLKAEIKTLRRLIHYKNRAISDFNHDLLKYKNVSVCWGTKAFFKKQHHLAENGYKSHAEWKADFNDLRSTSMTMKGSSDESFGNQNIQYNPATKIVQIRLPNMKKFKKMGKYLYLKDVEFPENLREEFYYALSNSNCKSPTRRSNLPVTYRIVRRINENTGERKYYLQASFKVPRNKPETNAYRGFFGVDLNADHIAVAEIDAKGNYVDGFSIPYGFTDKSSEEIDAILSDMISLVIKCAKKAGKPMVIEELDFEEKKRRLKEMPKTSRRKLSALVYAQFRDKMESSTNKELVDLIKVDPAFSSLIGAYKYQGLNISSHLKAALALARRGGDFSEIPEVYVTPFQREKDPYLRLPNDCNGHVYNFYRAYSRVIRSTLIRRTRQSAVKNIRPDDPRVLGRPSLRKALLLLEAKGDVPNKSRQNRVVTSSESKTSSR